MAQRFRQRLDLCSQRLLQLFGLLALGQVEEHRAVGDAFRWRPDLALITLADDEVIFPVARHSPVLHLCRALGNVDHARDPVPVLSGLAARSTYRPPGA